MNHFSRILKKPKYFLYLALFSIIFILSSNMHYNADEFNYSFITWTTTPISSIKDIFLSQKILYLNWTGRVFVHFLIQFTIFLGNNCYALLNSLIFCAFIYLILDLSNNNSNNNTFAIILIISITFLFIPVFGETVIWPSGSINYLWPSTLLLFFLKLNNSKKAKLPFIMIIAFLSGLSQEVVFVGGFIYLLFNLFIKGINKKTILTFSSFILGAAFLLLAPGNFIRASSTSLLSTIKILTIILGLALFISIVLINRNLSSKFEAFLHKIKDSKLIYLICILAILILFALTLTKYSPTNYYIFILYSFKFILVLIPLYLLTLIKALKEDIKFNSILTSFNYFIIGIIMSLAMSVMPEFPNRSLFLGCTFIIIAITNLLVNIDFQSYRKFYIPLLSVSSIMLVLTLHFYAISLNSWSNDFNSKISNYNSGSDALLPIQPEPILLIRNYYGAEPSMLTNTPNSITNFYASRYYNLNTIIGIKKDSITIKIEKDNIMDADIHYEYTDSKGNIIKCYPEKTFIEPLKSDSQKNTLFFSVPINHSDLKLINNSNLSIDENCISKYIL